MITVNAPPHNNVGTAAISAPAIITGKRAWGVRTATQTAKYIIGAQNVPSNNPMINTIQTCCKFKLK